MSGALVDLVAKGAQDVYLTGKPEVSFFRQKYSRHTNFAMKPVELLPMGSVSPNGEVSLKIPNKGDILCGVWLDHGDNNSSSVLGSRTTKPTVFELYIGGQLVDRQDSTFTNFIWPCHLVDSGAKGMFSLNNSVAKITPLHFSFCDNYGLPLVALQYHEVEIKVKFSSVNPQSVKFYAEYIVLDTSEREWFANNDHTLLIEQVQKIPPSVGGTNPVWDLSLLNHPVKSLHFSNVIFGSNYSIGDNAMLYLNGTQVFDSPMGRNFFVLAQPYYHCEHYSETWIDEVDIGGVINPHMYSFAMKASKHVPTGSCNFSRLDNAEFKATGASDSTNVNIYAVNWNVLRVKNGMAGLAFSN